MGSPACPTCKGTRRVLLTRNRLSTVTGEITSVAAGWTECECVVNERLASMAKELPTPPAPADEFVWLLEAADQSHQYLVMGSPGHPARMTIDPWQATRFKTRDAAALKFAMIGTGTLAALGIQDDLRPVEHGFVAPAPDAGAAERARRIEEALRKIANYAGPIVCEHYETCRHEACDFAYFAQTLAADTLNGTTTEIGDAAEAKRAAMRGTKGA